MYMYMYMYVYNNCLFFIVKNNCNPVHVHVQYISLPCFAFNVSKKCDYVHCTCTFCLQSPDCYYCIEHTKDFSLAGIFSNQVDVMGGLHHLKNDTKEERRVHITPPFHQPQVFLHVYMYMLRNSNAYTHIALW